MDVALLNEEEARALAGRDPARRAPPTGLLEQGARAVIIKKGEHGALYQSREERFITPAYPVEALARSHRGRGFVRRRVPRLAGALRAARTAARLRQALACGAAMASIAIEDFSPGAWRSPISTRSPPGSTSSTAWSTSISSRLLPLTPRRPDPMGRPTLSATDIVTP